MNPNDPHPEPLDPNERELARVVRALPGGEPPAMLDARILKAAQDAVAAGKNRRGPRWLLGGSAAWGIGSAAAAVLAIGVGWQVLNPSPATRLPMPARAPAPSTDVAEESIGTTVEFREQAPRAYDNSPPPVAATPAPPPARTAAARPPAAPAAPPPPLAANAPAVTVQGSGAINAIDVSSAESTTILTAEQMANIARTEAAGAAAAEREDAASARASADSRQRANADAAMVDAAAPAAAAERRASGLAADPAKAEADFQRRPSEWLNHIRALRDRGDDVAARASLRDFRKRHPDYLIPSDLTVLLEP